MKWFEKQTIDEKIIELEAKIQAWDETYGRIKDGIYSYALDKKEQILAELYKLRKIKLLKEQP